MNRWITIGMLSLVAASTATACAREPAKEPAPQEESPTKIRSGQISAEARKDPMKSAKGFVQDIEKLTTDNHDFRRVIYTAKNVQLVVMALKPGEHIGAEVHDVDQFFRVEEGTGEVVIDDTRTSIGPGSAIVVRAGAKHDVINTGTKPLQLYTLYAPPHHRDGVVHPTRGDAEKDKEHFDGKTTQ